MTAVQRNAKNVAPESPYACSQRVCVSRNQVHSGLFVSAGQTQPCSLFMLGYTCIRIRWWKYNNVKATVVYSPTKWATQNCLPFLGLVPLFETEQFSAIASQLTAQWPRHNVSSECLCQPQIPPRLTFVPVWHIVLLTFTSRGGEDGGVRRAKMASKRPTAVWLHMVIFQLFLWQPKPAFFFFFYKKAGYLEQFLWQQNCVSRKPGDISSHFSSY